MSFVVELWQSVFEPGTNPALIKATHGSFVALVATLTWMVWETRSIHFINLLIISIFLWASVIWFMSELAKERLKTNEELAQEADEEANEEAEQSAETASEKATEPSEKSGSTEATTTGAAKETVATKTKSKASIPKAAATAAADPAAAQ